MGRQSHQSSGRGACVVSATLCFTGRGKINGKTPGGEVAALNSEGASGRGGGHDLFDAGDQHFDRHGRQQQPHEAFQCDQAGAPEPP
jgi:hypothetical protein